MAQYCRVNHFEFVKPDIKQYVQESIIISNTADDTIL